MATSGFHALDPSVGSDGPPPEVRAWMAEDGNEDCFECGTRLDSEAVWVSLTFAVSLCSGCAGRHRCLGSHVSKVRSVHLDVWSAEDVRRLCAGGNRRCAQALGRVLGPCEPARFQDLLERCEGPAATAWARFLEREPEKEQEQHEVEERRLVLWCPPEAASSSSRDPGAHASALAARPGYFTTESGGFGCAAVREPERPGCCAPLGTLCGAGARLLERMWPRRTPPDEPLRQPEGSIFACAEAGDVPGVRWWLEAGGASPFAADEVGWTALLYAARFNRAEVCRLLLRSAPSARLLASTPEQGGLSWTPLQWAAQSGSAECVALLLDAGADPDGLVPHRSGKTPLRLASYDRRTPQHAEVVRLLLGYGARPCGAGCSEEYAARCFAQMSWQRRRKVFLIRDKAQAADGAEGQLRRLLRARPVLMAIVRCL